MKNLKQGSIIQTHLKEINKYVYIKFIDTREFLSNVSYPFQFRVHNRFYDKPPSFGIKEFDFDDLLISPLHLTGFLELIKQGHWKVLGDVEIGSYDRAQHAYKMAWPPNLLALFESIHQWRVLLDINNPNAGEIVSFERCAHLEYAENLGSFHLDLRITIEYHKINNIVDKLKFGELGKFEIALISRYINMPIYSALPNQFKGRLVPNDYHGEMYWLKNLPLKNFEKSTT